MQCIKICFIVWNDAEYEKYANTEKIKADKRYTFAEKLRDALRHSDTIDTDSIDDSYAVDISISGSRTDGEGIRCVSGNVRDYNMRINAPHDL